jgi:hypothetical protein
MIYAIKSTIFLDIRPCNPLSVSRRFGGTSRLYLQGRKSKFNKKLACKQMATLVSCWTYCWRKLHADCWSESGRGGNPMGQGPGSKADVEESPSRVLEWPLSLCLQCVVGRCHAEESPMSSTREFLLDCFLQTAKLLTIAFSSDGQVPLKQFIIPSISRQMPPRARSVTSKLPCLKRANHFCAVLQATESSP